MTTLLAPCAFCGSSIIIDNFLPRTGPMQYFGRCQLRPDCGILGPVRDTYDEALIAWNHWLVEAKRVLCPDLSGGGGK